MTIHKTFEIKVLDQHKSGGRILINTGGLDRDRDRVIPDGANVDAYTKNPVVQWAHNYKDPWATIGKTIKLERTADGLVADFELRPPVNDADPQNIIMGLWNGGWVRTASIGFIPTQGKPNKEGGTDFSAWDLLEFSLVPIPANADALRLAVKALDPQSAATIIPVNVKEPTEQPGTVLMDSKPEGRAWIRRLVADSDMGRQELYAAFRKHTIAVPEDAMLLQFDMTLGECTSVPHPDAGKTVTFKDAVFIPPLEYVSADFGRDAVYSLTVRECEDADAIKAPGGQWEVIELGDVLDSIAEPKSFGLRLGKLPGYGVDVLTARGIKAAEKMLTDTHTKRGRVLSKKNEQKIKDARDNLNEVLESVQDAPEADEDSGSDGDKGITLTDNESRELAESFTQLFQAMKENN